MTPLHPQASLRDIIVAVNALIIGGSHAVGTVTLRSSQTTTTVESEAISTDRKPVLFPTTANAAAALASTYIAPATVLDGSFVITHASNGQTDKTFVWVALGG